MLDLKNGRIDVMMSDYIPAQALAKQLGVLSSGQVNIVVPNEDAELQQAINKIIRQLQNEGFIDQFAVKHLPNNLFDTGAVELRPYLSQTWVISLPRA